MWHHVSFCVYLCVWDRGSAVPKGKDCLLWGIDMCQSHTHDYKKSISLQDIANTSGGNVSDQQLQHHRTEDSDSGAKRTLKFTKVLLGKVNVWLSLSLFIPCNHWEIQSPPCYLEHMTYFRSRARCRPNHWGILIDNTPSLEAQQKKQRAPHIWCSNDCWPFSCPLPKHECEKTPVT